METRELLVTVMVELSAPDGETLRRKGTIGSVGNRRCVVAAGDVDNWESVTESVVLAAIEDLRLEREYRAEVVRRIRLRYSADDEAAILRKRLALVDSGTESESVLEEFLEYNCYAELCKIDARAAVYPQLPDESAEKSQSSQSSQDSQISQESQDLQNNQKNETD